MSITPVTVFTDGSCNNNTRKGGWAFALLVSGQIAEVGYSREIVEGTSSNKMEMMAAQQGLLAVLRQNIPTPNQLTIRCDSKYTLQGNTEWRTKWLRNGWRNYEGGPVSNRVEWKALFRVVDQVNAVHVLNWKHVKGHNGHQWNELVDKLASYKLTGEEKDAILVKFRESATEADPAEFLSVEQFDDPITREFRATVRAMA